MRSPLGMDVLRTVRRAGRALANPTGLLAATHMTVSSTPGGWTLHFRPSGTTEQYPDMTVRAVYRLDSGRTLDLAAQATPDTSSGGIRIDVDATALSPTLHLEWLHWDLDAQRDILENLLDLAPAPVPLTLSLRPRGNGPLRSPRFSLDVGAASLWATAWNLMESMQVPLLLPDPPADSKSARRWKAMDRRRLRLRMDAAAESAIRRHLLPALSSAGHWGGTDERRCNAYRLSWATDKTGTVSWIRAFVDHDDWILDSRLDLPQEVEILRWQNGVPTLTRVPQHALDVQAPETAWERIVALAQST